MWMHHAPMRNLPSAIAVSSIMWQASEAASDNEGAGIWADGTVTIYNTNINNNTNGGVRLSATSKIINCSVVANTVSAVDLVNAARTSSNGGGAVYNTVLWHSTAVSKADTRPAFYNCAMTDVKVTDKTTHTDKNGNVRISNQNHSPSQLPGLRRA